MIAMADFSPGRWFTVAEAVAYMGCSEAWVRTLIVTGGLPGTKRIGKRVWLIPEAAATAARDNLTTRATGKRHLAKRPLAKRKQAKKAARRKK